MDDRRPRISATVAPTPSAPAHVRPATDPLRPAGRPWAAAAMTLIAMLAVDAAERVDPLRSAVTALLLVTVALIAYPPLTARLRAQAADLRVDGRLLGIAAAIACAAGAALSLFETGGRLASLDVLLLAAGAKLLPVLLAFSAQRRVELMLAALATVVTLAGTIFSRTTEATPLIFLFVLAGIGWCVTRLDPSISFAGPGLRRAVGVCAAAVVGFGAIGLAGQGTEVARAISGFMPSSGGVGSANDAALSGVGDGSDEVAGDDAASAGFDQTDRFTESGQDGLYDLWIESYGQPVVSGESQKMVGLRPQDVTVVTGSDKQDFRTGRPFELRRRHPRPEPADRHQSEALAYVHGRVPLHLRLATFDRYDGYAWQPEAPRDIAAALERRRGQDWFFLIDRPDSAALAEPDRHQVKVASLSTRVLPLPVAPLQYRLGRSTRVGFFRELSGGLLGTVRPSLPSGAVVDVVSHTHRPESRDDSQLPVPRPGRHANAAHPMIDGEQIAAWAGSARGWARVDAIVRGVTASARYQRGAAIDSDDPLADFITGRLPGASYHYASAVAIALAEAGYPVRLVSGLYADPASHQPADDITPLTYRDLHFWVELKLLTGAWAPLEVTPGYALLSPRPSHAQQLAALAAEMLAVAGRNAGWLSLAGLATFAAWVARRRLIEAADLAVWAVRCLGAPNRRIPLTLALLDRRWRRAGQARPAHVTHAAWLRRAGNFVQRPVPLLTFAHDAERYLYHPAAGRQQVAALGALYHVVLAGVPTRRPDNRPAQGAP